MTELAVVGMSPEGFAEAEATIEAGLSTFIDVGIALLAIRDAHGYRLRGYDTFGEYCQERWGFSRQRAYQLMDAAQVASTIVDAPPLHEGQARELAPLLRVDPDLIPEAWREVKADGRPVTAARVAEVVERKLPRPLPEPGSRPMAQAPLLRFCQDLPTATIVSLILGVCFPDAETALDMTYGAGNFWDGSAAVKVLAHDLLAERAPNGAADFRSLPYNPRSFSVVLFDPPHLADAHGVMAERFGTYAHQHLERVITDGVNEAWRLCKLGIVVKVTDHIHDEQLQLESDWVRDAMGQRPYEVVHQVRPHALVDPRWEEQLSAYNNGSSYLVFRRGEQRHVRRSRP